MFWTHALTVNVKNNDVAAPCSMEKFRICDDGRRKTDNAFAIPQLHVVYTRIRQNTVYGAQKVFADLAKHPCNDMRALCTEKLHHNSVNHDDHACVIYYIPMFAMEIGSNTSCCMSKKVLWS